MNNHETQKNLRARFFISYDFQMFNINLIILNKGAKCWYPGAICNCSLVGLKAARAARALLFLLRRRSGSVCGARGQAAGEDYIESRAP